MPFCRGQTLPRTPKARCLHYRTVQAHTPDPPTPDPRQLRAPWGKVGVQRRMPSSSPRFANRLLAQPPKPDSQMAELPLGTTGDPWEKEGAVPVLGECLVFVLFCFNTRMSPNSGPWVHFRPHQVLLVPRNYVSAPCPGPSRSPGYWVLDPRDSVPGKGPAPSHRQAERH